MNTLKKNLIVITVLLLASMYILPEIASAQENSLDKKSQESKLITEENNPYVDNDTQAVIPTIAAVLAIVGSAMAIIVGYHAAGKYAAKQAEVRLGLTPAIYKKNRWLYRSGISAGVGGVAGPLVALGFDDYFYGVK